MQANSAHRLFRSAIFSPGIYTDAFNGTDTGLQDVYPSFDEGDDLFWGASWLFRAGTEGIRAYNLTYYRNALEVTMDVAFMALDEPGVSTDYVNNLALIHAATISREVQYHLPAQSFIYDWICDSDVIKYTRNGRAFHFRSPHLGSTAAAAAMAAVYIKRNKDWRFVADNPELIKGAPLPPFRCPSRRALWGWHTTTIGGTGTRASPGSGAVVVTASCNHANFLVARLLRVPAGHWARASPGPAGVQVSSASRQSRRGTCSAAS